jgi:hypothetical protein
MQDDNALWNYDSWDGESKFLDPFEEDQYSTQTTRGRNIRMERELSTLLYADLKSEETSCRAVADCKGAFASAWAEMADEWALLLPSFLPAKFNGSDN